MKTETQRIYKRIASINIDRTNTANTLSIYRDYFMQLAILETLVMRGEVQIVDLLPAIIERVASNKIVMWSVTVPYTRDRVIYLQKIGLISVQNEIVLIEPKGIEALRNGTFQNMVSAAFFNHKTLRVATLALYISVAAAIVSILALILD